MGDVRVCLTVGGHGRPAGFEFQVGDRRVPFGFVEAHRMMNDSPHQLRAITVEHAEGGRALAVIGGQTVTLDEEEAQQLASLPGQLRWLFDLMAEMLSSRHQRERAG